MKALKLIDRLKVVYSAIYAKKHHGTVKEVVKEYGISRPAFYVYKREIIALLNAIGFDEDSFFSYITEHGEKGYTEIMEKIVEFKEKKETTHIEQPKEQTLSEPLHDKKIKQQPKDEIQHEQRPPLIAKIKQKLNETVYIPPESSTPVNIDDQKPDASHSTTPRPIQFNWKILIWVGVFLIAIFVFLTLKKKKTEKKEIVESEPEPTQKIETKKIDTDVYPFF